MDQPNNALEEPVSVIDDLMILATAGRALDTLERGRLKAAADYIEWLEKQLIKINAQLIETQSRLIAVNERLIEASRPKVFPKFPELNSGLMQLQVRT